MIRGILIAATVATVVAVPIAQADDPPPVASFTTLGLNMPDRAGGVAASRSGDRTPLLVKPSPMSTPTEPPPPPEPEPVVEPVEPVEQAPVARAPATGGMPSLLITIRANESGGNYAAYNPTGCEGYGCGGAYQLHARYAAGWAAEAGYPGQSSAAQTWDPAVQDAVALYKFYQSNPDGTLWCAWADYC